VLIRNICFAIIICFSFSEAQQEYVKEISPFPVTGLYGEFNNIFSGGHNNIEHQFTDIDGDGDYDLFFLDSDGSFGWYQNIGTPSSPFFRFSLHSIEGLFIKDWFYFVDIDNDGDYDLFTGGAADYIQFRRNTGTVFNPVFSPEIDTLKDSNNNPIFSEFGSNPVFADIDGDGDYDFISGNSAGTLTFYENTGTASSFIFTFRTTQWQGIQIIGSSPPGGSGVRHGSSSIEFKDLDNDGDLDIIWGDFFSQSLYYLRNEGTAVSANHQLIYSVYPRGADSLITSGFNMPRLVDIDNDGDLDLFVSVLYDPTVKETFIFFRNNGSGANPDFRRITDDYLYTLDAGTSSVPVLFDIDGDGDLDLFIGSGGNPNGTIYFYENEGSNSNAAYTLRNSRFGNIESELSVAPAFGDINGDGLADLLVGRFDGRIEIYFNTGSVNNPQYQFHDFFRNSSGAIVDIGVYARPFLFDAEGDGDLDLAVGRFNGRISFFRNWGTAINFSFTEEPGYFGDIDAGDNSAPFMFDYNNDGVWDLFTGNRGGQLFYFRNDGSNNAPVWNQITSNFLNRYSGGETVLFFADIDNDTDADLFIGNIKGGIHFFRNSTVSSVEGNVVIEPFSLQVYPNPFNSSTKISFNITEKGYYNLKIYSILGEEITSLYSGSLEPGNFITNWNGKSGSGRDVTSGTYIVTTTGEGFRKSSNIILLK
jgi:hypothetical protein